MIQVGKPVEVRKMIAEQRLIIPNDVLDFGTSLLHVRFSSVAWLDSWLTYPYNHCLVCCHVGHVEIAVFPLIKACEDIPYDILILKPANNAGYE